jgi:hypothetical protein
MKASPVRMMAAALRDRTTSVSALAKELRIHRATGYAYVQPDGTPTALGQALLAGTQGLHQAAAD